MSVVDPQSLIESLCALPRETEWLEFKRNRFLPERVGQYVSGLANAAILKNERRAYLVYGVDDQTHELVGTTLRLKARKVGSENFEHWLSKQLDPRISFEFVGVNVDGRHIELVCIDPAFIAPVRFQGEAYIRIDSVLKPLREYRERERALWDATSRFSFERGVATAHASEEELLEQFSAAELLKRMGSRRQTDGGVIDQLLKEKLVIDDQQKGFDVTNLLALLSARSFQSIPLLSRKALRVVVYEGASKLHAQSDTTEDGGYGLIFPELLAHIMEKVPHHEVMLQGTRTTVYEMPEIAIRELVANALIHQDLTSKGNGPLVEVFSDRIRITSPGEPLVATERFIDAPARSRNEELAGFMRRIGICEERGSGIDRALAAIESATLPPPLFQEIEGATVVTIFGRRTFAKMTREERLRACYQHAALRWEAGSSMSNRSLRQRLGLNEKQYPQASKLISDAISVSLIRPLDQAQPKRTARYVPFWA